MESIVVFQKNLEDQLGRKLKLKINDNHSTMLSVKWNQDFTHVSLHRMFLEAPQNVIEELIGYLRDQDKSTCTSIREYINLNLQNYDYSTRLNPKKMETAGRIYDLKEFYDDVNREYFEGQLDLNITWYGRPSRRRRTTMTFGLYEQAKRLVKIHRTIDSVKYPEFFISFIVYHEMLHHVCPSYYDDRGRHQVHSREFKAKEREFRYYDQVQRWMKEHHDSFFNLINR